MNHQVFVALREDPAFASIPSDVLSYICTTVTKDEADARDMCSRYLGRFRTDHEFLASSPEFLFAGIGYDIQVLHYDDDRLYFRLSV